MGLPGNPLDGLGDIVDDLTGSGSDPDQPTRDEVETWMADKGLTVLEPTMALRNGARGSRTRVYTAVSRAAVIADCWSWRLDVSADQIHIVMSDGNVGVHTWGV